MPAFPHMSVRDARFGGRPARVARVSFTGERGYEISVPARLGATLWQRAREAGAVPLGIEALGVLRAEKGYLYIGQDTDGETMPHDLGMAGPRAKRQDAYVGDRSLFTPAANKPDRKRLVGILADGAAPIPIGAHAIERVAGRKRSLGYVTSSYPSAHLGHPIALGLIEGGAGAWHGRARASRPELPGAPGAALFPRSEGRTPQCLIADSSGRPSRTGRTPASGTRT